MKHLRLVLIFSFLFFLMADVFAIEGTVLVINDNWIVIDKGKDNQLELDDPIQVSSGGMLLGDGLIKMVLNKKAYVYIKWVSQKMARINDRLNAGEQLSWQTVESAKSPFKGNIRFTGSLMLGYLRQPLFYESELYSCSFVGSNLFELRVSFFNRIQFLWRLSLGAFVNSEDNKPSLLASYSDAGNKAVKNYLEFGFGLQSLIYDDAGESQSLYWVGLESFFISKEINPLTTFGGFSWMEVSLGMTLFSNNNGRTLYLKCSYRSVDVGDNIFGLAVGYAPMKFRGMGNFVPYAELGCQFNGGFPLTMRLGVRMKFFGVVM